jgi:transcriptional regulator with XRE-family HTH domain
MERTGTTQETICKLTGIKRSQLSMSLRGSRRCSLRDAFLLSGISGIPVENLLPWNNFHYMRKVQPSVQIEDAK